MILLNYFSNILDHSLFYYHGRNNLLNHYILKINKLEKEYNDSIDYFFHDNKIMNEKKSKILEKYSGESKIYYGFIECIFMNISKRYSKYYRGLDDLLDDLFITPRRFFGNEYYDLNNFLINF